MVLIRCRCCCSDGIPGSVDENEPDGYADESWRLSAAAAAATATTATTTTTTTATTATATSRRTESAVCQLWLDVVYHFHSFISKRASHRAKMSRFLH